ncbi:MAG: hypothetical protein PHI32_04190 [Dysgonamonadaceae bacterium]|nr:hypothetical protein [Dysgonamonadaceae bacterium]
MKIKSIVLLSFVIFLGFSCTKDVYQVGTSKVSLEPENDLISLALGGYAAPWEGRFTLQWIEIETIPSFTAITGIDNSFYIISDNSLLKKESVTNSQWENLGRADKIKYISGIGSTLYAISVDGKLLKSDLDDESLSWKKLNSINKSINAIAVFNNSLYAVDNDGSFWVADLSKNELDWKETEYDKLNNIVSLVANNKKLIAQTKDGIMYQFGGDHHENTWVKIAYKNDVTIKEDIQNILMVDNSIYGVDINSKLYSGEHRSKKDIYSHALSIKDDKNTIVIVGLDVTGINDTFIGMVKEDIFNSTGIPASSIFINASHTHFAPVAQNWPTWQVSNRLADSLYLYVQVKDAIVKSVEESLSNLSPAELYFGRGKVDLGYNRSLAEHPELYDNAVDVIKVKYTKSNDESYLFMAACHPVFSTEGALHYTISANFPGVARKIIEEKTGTSNSIFLQGTAGDINPIDQGEEITGEKLANEVISVLSGPMEKIAGPTSFYLDTLQLPINPLVREEVIAFKKSFMEKEHDMISERNRKWSDIMLTYYDENTMPTSMPVYVHTLNIGNWKLVGFSREATSSYSLDVKNLWPDQLVSVAAYTNDVSSYLPTHLHIEKRNYEGYDSFIWYGMPDTFSMTVEDTIMSSIKENNR